MALLPAIAHARVERHIIADGLDMFQRCRPVADQSCAFYGRADNAFLDPIGLGAAEDELAIGNVDLPAAKAHCVDAIL